MRVGSWLPGGGLLSCESGAYELVGILKEDAKMAFKPQRKEGFYFIEESGRGQTETPPVGIQVLTDGKKEAASRAL